MPTANLETVPEASARVSSSPPEPADSLDGATLKDALGSSEVIQRLASGGATPASVPIDDGGGSPLSDPLQSTLGTSFGTDLSGVRVHTGSIAAAQMGAEAFTRGDHVHFASGSPSTDTLGHEVGHVLQQREGRVKPTGIVGGNALNDSPSLEGEADRAGRLAVGAMSGGGSESVEGESPSSGGTVQRKASGQPVVQRKLNMVAGYTEAMNWSGDAQELIEKFEEFEGLLEKCEAAASPSNKRLKRLKRFKVDIEATEISNKGTARADALAKIEAEIAVAESLYAAVGGAPLRKEAGDIDDPDGGGYGVPDLPKSETVHVGGGEDGVEGVSGLKPDTLQTAEEAEKEAAEEGAPVKLQLTVLDEELYTKKGRLGEVGSKASMGGELNTQSAQGSMGVAVSMFVGKKKEKTGTLVQGRYGQGRVKGEGSVGVKGEASGSAEGSYDLSKGEVSAGLKGKAAAFAGGSCSLTPTVEITDSSGTKLGGGSATLGVTYGAGAEYEGELSLKEWRIRFKSKGKVAVGLGAEWGVSVDLDLGAIAKKATGR